LAGHVSFPSKTEPIRIVSMDQYTGIPKKKTERRELLKNTMLIYTAVQY